MLSDQIKISSNAHNTPDDQARALGNFLRAARQRLAPGDFGISLGMRRRTAGLRREEVAAICGISPTWYTWIEQGRTTAISVVTLAELATGLRLSEAERAYLFQLAGRADPTLPAARNNDVAPYEALVDAINSPAYILNRHWDAIAWNPAAAEIFRDWLSPNSGSGTKSAPNLLRYVFLDVKAPELIVDWEERAWRIVAEYRADSVGSRHDDVHQALIEELQAGSSVFTQAWQSQKVLAREGGTRAFMLPNGKCMYWQYTLRMAQQNEIKLVVLHPQA